MDQQNIEITKNGSFNSVRIFALIGLSIIGVSVIAATYLYIDSLIIKETEDIVQQEDDSIWRPDLVDFGNMPIPDQSISSGTPPIGDPIITEDILTFTEDEKINEEQRSPETSTADEKSSETVSYVSKLPTNFKDGISTEILIDTDLLTQTVLSNGSIMSEHECLIEDVVVICYIFENNKLNIKKNLSVEFRNINYGRSRYIVKLFSSVDTNSVYFTSEGLFGGSNCCSVLRFDGNSLAFEDVDFGFDPYGGDRLSPSNKLVARLADETTIEIYDYEFGAVIQVVKINTNESLHQSEFGYGGAYPNMEWVDGNSLKYGVYKPYADDGREENELIEYRIASIGI
ncbi:hypothetical protein IPH92_02075 [Candidatus Kaiserbacteria bacterium]|nr:MAG: hypothetical protein IPH92_02075 [Candidatus Kaiserbacteria bacterium]